MRQAVELQVDFDDEDWRHGDTWRREGVLSGYVTLRLSGRKVLDYDVVGLNNSAVSLLRSVTEDHTPATSATEDEARWPLFFCAGNLHNRCGIIKDFRVQRIGESVILSQFHRCEVPHRARISVPWRSWARAVERLGVDTLDRLPPLKSGIKVRHLATYRRFRRDLKRALRTVQQSLDPAAGA